MKTAIVTGSTRGIGRAIGLELLRQGCDVVFNYSQNTACADLLQQELEQAGYSGRYQIVQADLSTMEGIQQLESRLQDRFQQINYLVLNTGITCRGTLEQLRPEDWERVLHTNLTIPVFLTQMCAPRICPEGCILFIGSVLGQYPHATSLPYGVSKAGIHYLTRALVKQFCESNIRVNCLAPGFVETDWQTNKPQEIRRSIESKIALHRFAEPEEIAQLAWAILQNSYINGSIVNVDGGYCYQ